MSNLWLPGKHTPQGDANFQVDLTTPEDGGALFKKPQGSSIYVPGEEKLRTGHERYKPWAVGLKIQLTPSSMSWDQEVWFLRAADDNVVAMAHTAWAVKQQEAWRRAGNTGERPLYPDTVGRTACVLIDEGDWFEYFNSARRLRATNDKLELTTIGEQIMDIGTAPLIWCLRGHCFDFDHIFEDDSDQDRLLLTK